METSSNNLFSRSVVHNFLYHEEKFTAADIHKLKHPTSCCYILLYIQNA